jgi:hypothetical protein
MRCRIKNISDPHGPSVTLGGIEVGPGEISGILELKEGSPDHQVAMDFHDQGLIEIILTQAGRRNRDSRLTGTGMGNVLAEADVKGFRGRNRKGRTSFGTRKNSHGIPGHPFGTQSIEVGGNAKVLSADELGKKRPKPFRERDGRKEATIRPSSGTGIGMPPIPPGSEVLDASGVVKKAEAPKEPVADPIEEPTVPVVDTPVAPESEAPESEKVVDPDQVTAPQEPPVQEPVVEVDLEELATKLAKYRVKDLEKVAGALEIKYDKSLHKGPLVKFLSENLVDAEPGFRETFVQLLAGENDEVE